MNEQMMDFAHKIHGLKNNVKPLEIKSKQDAAHYVKTALRLSTFSWLVIFDNAASFAAVSQILPETHGQKDKHVLISSLSSKDAPNVIRLDTLTAQEALEFLRGNLKNNADTDLAMLAQALGNHPLALTQAVAYIKATPGMAVPAYVAFFTKNKNAFWKSEQKALGGHPLLYTAIKMSIDKLKNEHPSEYPLLVFLAMGNTAKLDQPLVEKWFLAHKEGDMAGFGALLETSLVTPSGTQNKNDFFKIHDYVRDVILHDASKEDKILAADQGTKIYQEMLSAKVQERLDRLS